MQRTSHFRWHSDATGLDSGAYGEVPGIMDTRAAVVAVAIV